MSYSERLRNGAVNVANLDEKTRISTCQAVYELSQLDQEQLDYVTSAAICRVVETKQDVSELDIVGDAFLSSSGMVNTWIKQAMELEL